MLYLVGLGISDEKDISLRGLEILKSCDKVFMETYTNDIEPIVKKRLEKMTGKKIELLDRKAIEESNIIISEIKEKNKEDNDVALIVPGDPLIATTHLMLLANATEANVPYRVIHSSSIFSAAIGESGLHVYKFGNSVTIPKWHDNYKPVTPYDIIFENRKRGLHTLLLVDIFKGRNIPFCEVMKMLCEMERIRKKRIFVDSTMLVILTRLGYEDSNVMYVSVKDLKIEQTQSRVKSPYVIIYPGELHFTEEEWLERFRI